MLRSPENWESEQSSIRVSMQMLIADGENDIVAKATWNPMKSFKTGRQGLDSAELRKALRATAASATKAQLQLKVRDNVDRILLQLSEIKIDEPIKLFDYLLNITPAELHCDVHYHLIAQESAEKKVRDMSLADIFMDLLDTTFPAISKGQMPEQVNTWPDEGKIARKWEGSQLIPIRVEGILLGHAEVRSSRTFQRFPNELPNALRKVTFAIEVFLARVRDWMLIAENRKQNEENDRLINSLSDLANKLAEESRRHAEASITDELTGINNRKGYFKKALEFFLDAPAERPASILMMDIDHFKQINDTHGHNVWDRVLQYTVGKLKEVVSEFPEAIFARFGWEEFNIILPDLPPDAVKAVGDRICQDFKADMYIDPDKQKAIPVTLSIGIAQVHKGVGEKAKELFGDVSDYTDEQQKIFEREFAGKLSEDIKRADIALYLAKNTGRARAMAFEMIAGADTFGTTEK